MVGVCLNHEAVFRLKCDNITWTEFGMFVRTGLIQFELYWTFFQRVNNYNFEPFERNNFNSNYVFDSESKPFKWAPYESLGTTYRRRDWIRINLLHGWLFTDNVVIPMNRIQYKANRSQRGCADRESAPKRRHRTIFSATKSLFSSRYIDRSGGRVELALDTTHFAHTRHNTLTPTAATRISTHSDHSQF